MYPAGAWKGVEGLLEGHLGLLAFERGREEGKWLSPTTCPSGPTEASLQSGLRRAHAAGLWLPLGSPVQAPPQGRLTGTARSPLLPRLEAGPAEECASVIQGPPLLRQPQGCPHARPQPEESLSSPRSRLSPLCSLGFAGDPWLLLTWGSAEFSVPGRAQRGAGSLEPGARSQGWD